MSVRRAVLLATAAATLLAGCSASDDEAAEEPVAVDPAGSSDPTGEDEGGAEGGADDAAADGEVSDEPRTFAAGEEIAVEVTWIASDDGGRRTGVFGGYRGTLTFVHHDPMDCSFGGPAEGGRMEPGTSHEVAITCAEDLTLAPHLGMFTVAEGGRLVGDGRVLP